MVDPKKELIGRKKLELNTPCLVLDLDLLDEKPSAGLTFHPAAGQ